MRAPHDRLLLRLALGVAVAQGLAVAGLYLTRMSLDIGSIGGPLMTIGALAVVALYCRARAMYTLQSIAEITLLFVALHMALLPISYIPIRFNMPIADPWLAGMDAAMGFDWGAYVALIDGSPVLSSVLLAAYMSFGVQLFFLPVYFVLAGYPERAFGALFAYGMIVIIAAAVSTWFPSEGALHYYGYSQADLPHVNTHFTTAFLDQFRAARSQPDFVMSLETVEGLLTFPSVHAAVALLATWLAWTSRWLRLPVLALNLAMAASAISHGGHFAIDILAGFVLAAVSILIASRLFPRFEATAMRRPSRQDSACLAAAPPAQ